MSHFGCDISSNNVHPINWVAMFNELHAAGGEQPFAIIKITQGNNYVNPDAAVDVAGARAAGFAVAGYLMDQGNAPVGSEEQLFLAHCQLPQANDIELPEGLSEAQYAAHSHDLAVISPHALDYLNVSEVEAGFPEDAGLWLAEPNNQPGVTSVPCECHQYTWTASVRGVAGVFDLNYWCGTEAQFSAFFLTPTPKPPAPPAPPPEDFDMFATDPTSGHLFATDANGALYAPPESGVVVGNLVQHADYHAGDAESGHTNPCVGLVFERDADGTWGPTYITKPTSGKGGFGPYDKYHFHRNGTPG